MGELLEQGQFEFQLSDRGAAGGIAGLSDCSRAMPFAGNESRAGFLEIGGAAGAGLSGIEQAIATISSEIKTL